MKKILIIIMVFLLIGAYLILKNLDLGVGDLEDKEERKTFVKVFWSWLKDVGRNFKSITGEVIALDWLPKNETGSD